MKILLTGKRVVQLIHNMVPMVTISEEYGISINLVHSMYVSEMLRNSND